MRVLTSPDRVWRAEQRRDGWRLSWHGALVLQRATEDKVRAYIAVQGDDPDQLRSD